MHCLCLCLSLSGHNVGLLAEWSRQLDCLDQLSSIQYKTLLLRWCLLSNANFLMRTVSPSVAQDTWQLGIQKSRHRFPKICLVVLMSFRNILQCSFNYQLNLEDLVFIIISSMLLLHSWRAFLLACKVEGIPGRRVFGPRPALYSQMSSMLTYAT